MHAAHEPGATEYRAGIMRFAGSTYDPTSHYRAARVFDFFDEQGLTPERLRQSYLHPGRRCSRSASTCSAYRMSRATARRHSMLSAAFSPSR